MSILPKPRHTHVDAVTDQSIARAIMNNQGLLYLAADEIGMCYTWFLTRIKQSEYLQAIKEACIQLRIDKAEKVLCDMVEAKNFNAVALTLRTLGRSRGYIENAPNAHPADAVKAFNDTMALWGMKQKEELEQAQIDLNSEDTIISNDS